MSIRGVNVGGNLFDITDSSNVAPIELTNFATRNYAKDRCFIMIDGLLYRAMVAISSGDPIVINGNAKRTTLDEMFSVVETDSDLIAPTEDGATSSDDYAIGAQIVRSGILYKVIDDIAEGDAFVVDNNIELAGSVSEQISSINEALTNEVSARAELGAHNLVLFPYSTMSGSSGGVQYSVDKDGVISTNTVTSGESYFSFCQSRPLDQFALNVGESYILSGGINNNKKLILYFTDSTNTIVGDIFTSTGNEVQFTVPTGAYYVNMNLFISNGTSVANDKFYPMIRLASDPNTTYQPYAMTNRELTADKAEKGDLTSINITGSTNNTGSTIASGTFFYLNRALVRAKTNIANGATLTLNTNYEQVTVGGLNALNVSRHSTTKTTNSDGTISVSEIDDKIVLSAECDGYFVEHAMDYLANGTRRHFFRVLDFVTLQPIKNTSVELISYYI